jgi:hypothetical protein
MPDRRLRRQRRIPGLVRTPMSTAVDDALEEAIAFTMARFRVSRSFVLAAACKLFFGIDDDDPIDAPARRNGRRRPGMPSRSS